MQTIGPRDWSTNVEDQDHCEKKKKKTNQGRFYMLTAASKVINEF